MSSTENIASRTRVVSSTKVMELPAGSIRFDAAMVALTYWFTIGMYLDGGAHQRGLVDDSFFTPWHALLYSGAAAVGLILGFTQIRNMLKGHTLLRALPFGYFPALVGIGIFAIGGVFDLVLIHQATVISGDAIIGTCTRPPQRKRHQQRKHKTTHASATPRQESSPEIRARDSHGLWAKIWPSFVGIPLSPPTRFCRSCRLAPRWEKPEFASTSAQ